MLRRVLPIIFLLMFIFLLALPVLAQDTPTPEGTAEETPVVIVTPAPVVTPTPILTPDNAISVSTILYGLIIAVLGGGTVGFVLNRFGSNKANLDAMEKLYLSQSPDAQERERQLFIGLRDVTLRVLDLVDKVTDGQPNAEVAQLAAVQSEPIRHEIVVTADNEVSKATLERFIKDIQDKNP